MEFAVGLFVTETLELSVRLLVTVAPEDELEAMLEELEQAHRFSVRYLDNRSQMTINLHLRSRRAFRRAFGHSSARR